MSLLIRNQGQALVETNFWDSPSAQQGFFSCRGTPAPRAC